MCNQHRAMFGGKEFLVSGSLRTDVVGRYIGVSIFHHRDSTFVRYPRVAGNRSLVLFITARINLDVTVYEECGLCVHLDIVEQNVFCHIGMNFRF